MRDREGLRAVLSIAPLTFGLLTQYNRRLKRCNAWGDEWQRGSESHGICAAVRAARCPDPCWRFCDHYAIGRSIRPHDMPGGNGPSLPSVNGFANGIDSNHRLTTSVVAYSEMQFAGWIGEGLAMCAPQGD